MHIDLKNGRTDKQRMRLSEAEKDEEIDKNREEERNTDTWLRGVAVMCRDRGRGSFLASASTRESQPATVTCKCGTIGGNRGSRV